jgi:hypothetical protein
MLDFPVSKVTHSVYHSVLQQPELANKIIIIF